MNDYKYFIIAVCTLILVCGAGMMFDKYLKSQEKQKELEIKKLELQLKIKIR